MAKIDEPHYYAFCYHDVRPDVFGQLDNDGGAVNSEYLAHHFQWLKDNGYQVVSNRTINRAMLGEIKLPEKSISLSFDDGFSSVYYEVYPLLKAFNYPATIGIVTDWIETQKDDELGRKFLTWEQVNELSQSPLIEIASHSHNLHQGIIANPQGNKQPAASSRSYNSTTGYETDHEYNSRIKRDLESSKALILLHTGQAPTTLIWPYGSYSNEAWKIAQSLGYTQSMVLDSKSNKLNDSEHIKRHLIGHNPSAYTFSQLFDEPSYIRPHRMVHVDLDYVFDTDLIQQEKNLDILVDRIKDMEIDMVFLQAFADPDGDGNANALYFPNRILPIRSDLFNRASWQLKTRANVSVYAWLPVSAYVSTDEKSNQAWQVKSIQKDSIKNSTHNYRRWSIFSLDAQTAIKTIYADLAKQSQFDGLLFHDDGLLTDKEDFHPAALSYYQQKGLSFSQPLELINDTALNQQWSRLKTQALIDFTLELRDVVKRYRPDIKTARNLYARPVIQPDAEQWFAQNLKTFVAHYDFTAIMAMPYLENADNPVKWLADLLKTVHASGIDKQKILFELQTQDWRSKQVIPVNKLIGQIKQIQQAGFTNFGYYPDDFISNHPPLKDIFPYMSLADFPYKRR